jgi:hypothetical protein
MSAFVCQNETFIDIVNYLAFHEKSESICGDGRFTRKGLASKLFRMNRDAVLQRYSNDRIEDYPIPKWNFEGAKIPSGSSFYTRLACYLYQCCESDVPNRAMFKRLASIRDAMFDDGYRTISEYWG